MVPKKWNNVRCRTSGFDGKLATAPHRENLASLEKGEFEVMAEKIKLPERATRLWSGRTTSYRGTVAIGARMPACGFHINLNTSNLDIAQGIAKKICFIGARLSSPKAMGVDLKDRHRQFLLI